MTAQPAINSPKLARPHIKVVGALSLFDDGGVESPYMMGGPASSWHEASKVSSIKGQIIRTESQADTAVNTVVSDTAQFRKESRKNLAEGCQATVSVAYCDSLGKDDPDQVRPHGQAINQRRAYP